MHNGRSIGGLRVFRFSLPSIKGLKTLGGPNAHVLNSLQTGWHISGRALCLVKGTSGRDPGR